MAKYPTSVLDGAADGAFKAVLHMHAKEGARVLDVTYGDGISWGEPSMFDTFTLTKSDIKPPYEQDLFTAHMNRPDWLGAFDVVYYDPPWYIDIEKPSSDPRHDAYGGYGLQRYSLNDYMCAPSALANLLAPGGKIIVKCGDQFHVPTRKLYLHHVEWVCALRQTYDVVDLYVYRNHSVSPTAFQVKDRPCCVIAHSYFIIGAKR